VAADRRLTNQLPATRTAFDHDMNIAFEGIRHIVHPAMAYPRKSTA
jgi:hypothetical protein